jgi:hypothetical protein
MAIAAGASVVVIALGIYLLTAGKPKPVVAPPVAVAPPQPAPAPPPKKVEVPPPPPPPPLPEAPPPRLRVHAEFNVAQLQVEHAADPAGFDQHHAGKTFLLRGVCVRVGNGAVVLGDSSDDAGVSCALSPDGAGTVPQPGQPVTVRGTYSADLRLTDCAVLKTTAPADDEYRYREVQLTGVVERASPTDEQDRVPVVVLEPPGTEYRASVRCVCQPSQVQRVQELRPGQPVMIRGRCVGRSFRTVRLENCVVVQPADVPDPRSITVTSEQFFADYDVDLRVAGRPDLVTPPVSITAESLVAAFEADPKQANATFRFKRVEVTGTVVGRNPAVRAVAFWNGAGRRYQVVAAFTSAGFEAVLPDDATLTIRGICAGTWAKGFIRIDNAEVFDPDAGNPAARTVVGFLPFRRGHELFYDQLFPGKTKDHPIQRWSVKFADPDQIQATLVRTGTFSGPSLFAEPIGRPRWGKDLSKRNTPQVTRYRLSGGGVELCHPLPPGPSTVKPWWDPVLKPGRRRGQSWSLDVPGIGSVRYTVVGFSKDPLGRAQVEIRRVVKHADNPNQWEEESIVYVHDVGEVRRSSYVESETAPPVLISEMRLVDEPSAAEPIPVGK